MSLQFLIGTHRFLVRAEIDDDSNFNAYAIGGGMFYGMTQKPDERHIIVRRASADIEGHPVVTSRSFLEVWDKDVTQQESAEGQILKNHGSTKGMFDGVSCDIPIEVQDVHQIAYDGEGLYICDCMRNHLLYIFDDDNLEVSTSINYRYLEHCFDNTAMDHNHPNSILLLPDNNFAVLLHNKGMRESEIAFGKRVGEKMAIYTTIPLAHHGAHNIHPTGDSTIIYNASAAGKVVHYDLKTQEILQEAELGGHTKGLLSLTNYYLVGVSESVKFIDRFGCSAAIAVLHKETLEEIDRWPMENIGNINEFYLLKNGKPTNNNNRNTQQGQTRQLATVHQ